MDEDGTRRILGKCKRRTHFQVGTAKKDGSHLHSEPVGTGADGPLVIFDVDGKS